MIDITRIRPATEQDTPFLYELYCDPLVIYNSGNSSRSDLWSYRAWLSHLLSDPKRHQVYVALYRNTSIGTGRLEAMGNGIAEISYSLIASVRKSGHGTELLRLLLVEAKHLKYTQVKASVRCTNIASLHMILKEQFVPSGAEFMDCLLQLEQE